METMDVPCTRCDEFKKRFEDAGYVVLGCDAASEPGMCTLRYEARNVAPAGTAALAATAATAATAGSPAVAVLTDLQQRTARAIVNIFETGSVLGDYGKVTLLPDDPGRLTYGRSQTTLASGNLSRLIERYCSNPGARFARHLRPALAGIAAQAASVDSDVRLHNLLRACADDPVMRETQDAFFDSEYWTPAMRNAIRFGIESALGVAVVYDSTIHGSWIALRDRTTQAIGELGTIGEREWIRGYVAERRNWLASHPKAILRATTYRMDAFNRLIDQGYWGLPLPLMVRAQEISQAALHGTPVGCYDGPQPGTRILALGSPLLRGLDVRLIQVGLSNQGMNLIADGIFGQTSRQRIIEYQIAHGAPATGTADQALVAELSAWQQ